MKAEMRKMYLLMMSLDTKQYVSQNKIEWLSALIKITFVNDIIYLGIDFPVVNL